MNSDKGLPRLFPAFGSLWVLLLLAMPHPDAFSQKLPPECGGLYGPGQYGPYDYRNEKPQLAKVESSHFRPEMEALIQGTNSSKWIGGAIDYTLRASPNHHRALLAAVRYTEKMKTPKPYGYLYSMDCYFERGIAFRSDDLIVRMIFATYLAKNTRVSEAEQQLEYVVAHAGDNAFSYYNVGLIYFDMKNYDKALSQAHKAIALGLNRSELRDKLHGLGKWVEPAPVPVGTK